jgi:O-antigen/teichoic acid export membrane protein
MRIAGEVRSRLLRGLSATALGPLITAAIQLGSVPILLYALGTPKYGDWLVLSAIPSYLGLADLGLGDASGSDMTVRVAAGDRDGALRTFQSSWILVSAICLIPLLAAMLLTGYIPWARLLKLSTVSGHDAGTVILLLAAYILVGQQSGVLESGYRADGNFATGASLLAVFRLVEAVASTAVGIATKGLIAMALALLVTRSACVLVYLVVLLHKSPWLSLGFRHASWRTIRQLARPSLAFMALPAGQALSLQGATILIGSQLGSVAVVVFSTTRTVARIPFQVFNSLSIALWPELSRAFGSGMVSLARELHRQACRASIGLSLLSAASLWAVGPLLFRLWTGHSVNLDLNCFHVLLVVVVANSFWYASLVVPMSTNAHAPIAAGYLLCAIASLGLGWILLGPFGISGMAVALLAIDFGMLWLVLPAALRQVEDTPRAFWAALFPWRGAVPALAQPADAD